MLTPEERRLIEEFVRDPEAVRQSAEAYFDRGPNDPVSRLTRAERKMIEEFARDPEAMRESARIHVEGLLRALRRHRASGPRSGSPARRAGCRALPRERALLRQRIAPPKERRALEAWERRQARLRAEFSLASAELERFLHIAEPSSRVQEA